MALRENLSLVRERITQAALAAGRDPQGVTLVAVTKTVAPEQVLLARELGLADFGENRVQEARVKAQQIQGALRWHLIGPLQTNKVRAAVGLFSYFHALDREAVADRLAQVLAAEGLTLPVLVEVNLSGEVTKAGLAPGAVAGFLERLVRYPQLVVRGLTTVPPRSSDPEASRPFFRALWELRERLATPERPLPDLSMGMTDDYVVAIQEGATYIRLGRALFGPRL